MRSDEFAALDDRLASWRIWYLQAIKLPFREPGSILGQMVAEAEEIRQKTRRVERAIEVARSARKAMQGRADEQRIIGVIEGDNAHLDRALHIEAARKLIPTQTGGLPWASMIKGSGMRSDPDSPLDEEMHAAIECLPRAWRLALHVHILRDSPAQEKCRALHISERTFWRRVLSAKQSLKREIGS